MREGVSAFRLGMEGDVLAIGGECQPMSLMLKIPGERRGGNLLGMGGGGGDLNAVEGVVGELLIDGLVDVRLGKEEPAFLGPEKIFHSKASSGELPGRSLVAAGVGQIDHVELRNQGGVQVAFAVEAIAGTVDDADVGDVGLVAGGAAETRGFGLRSSLILRCAGGNGKGLAVGRPLWIARAFGQIGEAEDGLAGRGGHQVKLRRGGWSSSGNASALRGTQKSNLFAVWRPARRGVVCAGVERLRGGVESGEVEQIKRGLIAGMIGRHRSLHEDSGMAVRRNLNVADPLKGEQVAVADRALLCGGQGGEQEKGEGGSAETAHETSVSKCFPNHITLARMTLNRCDRRTHPAWV